MPERHVIPNERTGEPLSPPGDERRDELARRTDELEEQAEAVMPDVGAIDPSKLRVENELAQHFPSLEHVSHADLAYHYCWVYTGQHGRFITEKIYGGYEVVQGDMPEALELKGMAADTTRRLGDCILMRVQLDRHLIHLRRDKELRRRQQEAVTSTLEELGERHRDRGVRVLTGDAALDRMGASKRATVSMYDTPSRMAIRQQAMQGVDQQLREGRVPGMPGPAKGGK